MFNIKHLISLKLKSSALQKRELSLCQESEEMSHRLGETICKRHI